MKFFIRFLSLNILLITSITCEDISEISLPKKNPISSSVSKNQAHANEDNCSPFCTCNCCGQPFVSLQRSIASVLPGHETYKSKAPEYKNKFVSGFLNNIWQPPKLILNSTG